MTPTYQSTNKDFTIFQGDCTQTLENLKDQSFDMIFADPPYFLSNGGITFQNGKVSCVDKGDWDKARPIEEVDNFNLHWLTLCHKKLKANGTIWVSGTYHNIFSIAKCLNQLGFKILNIVTWQKTNPAPSITRRTLTYASELIIWARKTKHDSHKYNADLMQNINNGCQLTDVWPMSAVEKWEKTCGKHPTQKPLGLLGRIILASTDENDWVLDPFCGSGTTGIATSLLKRNFVGLENESQFVLLSKSRREELDSPIIRKDYLDKLLSSIRTNFELTKVKNGLLIGRIGSPAQWDFIQTGIYNLPIKKANLAEQISNVEYILLFDKGKHHSLHLFQVNKAIKPQVLTKEEITSLANNNGINYTPKRANTYLCIRILKHEMVDVTRNKILDTTKFLLPYEIDAPFWFKPTSILTTALVEHLQ